MSAQVQELTGHLALRQIRDLIAEHGIEKGSELIAAQHRADVEGLTSHLAITQEEAGRSVLSANRAHHMAQDLLGAMSRETHRAAANQASAVLAGTILRSIGDLAAAAGDSGKVSADDLAELLARPLPQETMRYPYIATFWPSHEHAKGHFATADGVVHQVWPFSGWALVLTAPGSGYHALQGMYAVDGETVPTCTLHAERGLIWQKFS